MSTDIELIVNTLQALHRDALTAAWPTLYAPDLDRYPTKLTTASLPALLTWPAGGEWYVKGNGYAQEIRTYNVTAYIAPEAQDDIPSRAAVSARLLAAVRALYLTARARRLLDPEANDQGMEATIESVDQMPQTDSGLTAAPIFEGVKFSGFVVPLKVRAIWPVN